MIFDVLKALLLGLVEGLTEFVPVSSTGHLLLIQHFLGFSDEEFGKTFVVLVQLGAILAIVLAYFARLWRIFLDMFHDPAARRFVIGVLIAFLPAALIGAAAHGIIKGVLFNPWIVCCSLIVGGAVLLWVDQLELAPRFRDATRFTLPTYLLIGIAQCLAMIPGVSRSGATIVSAMLLGADKRSAAEFSFFLAIPTMTAAFVLDAWESRAAVTGEFLGVLAVGFVVSFISGAFVIKTMIGFVGRHGFAPFAWWRIVIGAAGLALVYFA
jgi:undecaprenyl-diphosphatase